jgi:hypothetical protein
MVRSVSATGLLAIVLRAERAPLPVPDPENSNDIAGYPVANDVGINDNPVAQCGFRYWSSAMREEGKAIPRFDERGRKSRRRPRIEIGDIGVDMANLA